MGRREIELPGAGPDCRRGRGRRRRTRRREAPKTAHGRRQTADGRWQMAHGRRQTTDGRIEPMRIAFFGTPDFATTALLALIGEGHDVVAVVTQPDRPRGRSHSTLEPSPVKAVALAESIPVLQPERPRGPAFEAELRALAPDLSIVVAYGHILPSEIIDLPRLGTINVHASLLPEYRGAAPIQAAIRDGVRETGVTIMQMVPALDAGPVLLALHT